MEAPVEFVRKQLIKPKQVTRARVSLGLTPVLCHLNAKRKRKREYGVVDHQNRMAIAGNMADSLYLQHESICHKRTNRCYKESNKKSHAE